MGSDLPLPLYHLYCPSAMHILVLVERLCPHPVRERTRLSDRVRGGKKGSRGSREGEERKKLKSEEKGEGEEKNFSE